MAHYTRFRVRRPEQTWADAGPDLLRRRPNAFKAMRSLLPAARRSFQVNDGTGWRKVRRSELEDAFNRWDAPGTFRVSYIRRNGNRKVCAIVRRELVARRDVSSCSPGVTLAWSLLAHAFPGIRFAGGYVLKETVHRPWAHPSGCHWSDHGWGDAVDATENRAVGVFNDKVTDWLARMRKTGSVDFDYVLGSRRGRVVKVDRRGRVSRSSASSSHLWHNHVSVIDHGGARPPVKG